MTLRCHPTSSMHRWPDWYLNGRSDRRDCAARRFDSDERVETGGTRADVRGASGVARDAGHQQAFRGGHLPTEVGPRATAETAAALEAAVRMAAPDRLALSDLRPRGPCPDPFR